MLRVLLAYLSRARSRRPSYGYATALTSILLVAGIACAQDSQFIFDPTGNLQAQVAENLAAPQIIGQPQMQVVIPGESASFSVGVADTSGVTYQWFFNSSAIPGATADSLLLPNVSSTNEGPYWVAVSNAFGSLGSTLANLYIDSRGCGMPDSWQLQYFGTLGQPATGDFDGDGVSNLQEFLDGTNPTNSASALYRISLVNDGGTVVVSPDQSTYTNGQAVTLTATGSDSAPFHAWTGDVASRSNSITVTMTSNLNLFAHFLPFTLVWTNLASGDWNVASNWSPNLVPASNESVIIGDGFAGDSFPTITENNDVDLLDFTIGNSYWAPVLTGSGRITISGSGVWNSGTMSGTGATVVLLGASFTLTSSGLTLNRTLENAGSMVLSGTSFAMGGILTNDAGAQFELLNPTAINISGGSPRFDNAGLLITAASAGVTSFNGVPFNNFGTLQIQGGTLILDGGGTDAGVINVPAGATLDLAGGVFSSSGNPSITGAGNFLVSGAIGTLGGTVNLTGSNVFSNGSIDFTGSYILTNAPLPISGCAVSFDGTSLVTPTVLTLSSGSLGGSSLVTVSSAMNWSGGSLDGIGRTLILPSATLNITCTNPPMFITSRTLENAGSAIWTGTSSISIDDGVITNDAGASFNALSPMNLAFGGGSPRFDNAGVFRTAPTAGTTSLGVAFNNYNDTQIQGGTLQLAGGGVNNSTIEVPAGTTLDLSGGSFNASPASSITGAGNFTVSFSFATLAGLLNVSGTNTFGNGSAELSGDYICTNNTMIISGATVSFDGTGPVSPAVLNLSRGTLGGSNLVTVGNALNWTGGSMGGTGRTIIPSGATLTINIPTFTTITSRTLENAGVAVWTGAGSINMNGGVITNDVGALFNVQTASSISIGGGSPRFDNAGIFRKSVSAGTFTLAAVPFTNYGTVDIQSGVLFANVGGFGSASNAVLNCAIGGPIPATNYGQLQVSGSVNLNGTLSVNLINNYIPTTADQFTLVTAGTCNGAFSSFIYPSSQVTMVLSNTPTSVIAHATSILAIPQPALFPPQLSGSNIILSWAAVSNATYRVQFNPDLSPSNWTALPGDVTAASNTASKTDSLTSSNRFYRILGLHP